MKNLFSKQLEGNPPVNQDIFDELNDSKYFNGDDIEIGDVVLFGMLIGDVIDKEGEIPHMPIELIKLNERHFYLFEPSERNKGMSIPVFKYKEEHKPTEVE